MDEIQQTGGWLLGRREGTVDVQCPGRTCMDALVIDERVIAPDGTIGQAIKCKGCGWRGTLTPRGWSN